MLTTHKTRQARWEALGLAAILLLAAVLRLGWPRVSEFKRDEANMARAALDVARGRDLPLLGLSSSVNIPNSPASVYLFAPPFVLSRDPTFAVLWVGALNVLAVALTWALVRRFYGAGAAWVAGLLYAASPWAAIFSRKIWAQDLLPPFIVAAVLLGLLGALEDRRWGRRLHLPMLALAVQIHYAAFTLLPLSAWWLWRAWRRGHKRDVLWGVGLTAVGFAPFVLGLARAGLLAPHVLRERLAVSDTHPVRALSTTALDYARLLVAGQEIHALAGPQQFRAYLAGAPNVFPLFWAIPVGVALGAAWLVRQLARRTSPRPAADGALLAWLALPVLAFSYEWVETTPHYLIPLMPAAYVIAGIGAARIWDALRERPMWRAAGFAALLALVGMQVGVFGALMRFVDTHSTPGGFGTPLHYLLDVRGAMLGRDPSSVLVVGTGEVAPYDEAPAVWGVLLDGVPLLRFVDGRRTVVIPAAPSLELVDWQPDLWACDAACKAAGEQWPRRNGEPPYVLRAAPSADAYTWTPLEAPARLENSARLLGWAREDDALLLAWELGGPVATDYQAFVHVLDAAGRKVAQADRPTWHGGYWRAGDVLLLRFPLSLPPESAALFVGMYTVTQSAEGVQYHNAALVDERGAYLAQGVTVPLTP